MINNPWKVQAPFQRMFTDIVQFTSQADGTVVVVPACVFPIEETDPFAETSIENEAKKLNVLVSTFNMKKNGLDEPKIGDTVSCEDGTTWKVCDVNRELTWYRVTVRGF